MTGVHQVEQNRRVYSREGADAHTGYLPRTVDGHHGRVAAAPRGWTEGIAIAIDGGGRSMAWFPDRAQNRIRTDAEVATAAAVDAAAAVI